MAIQIEKQAGCDGIESLYRLIYPDRDTQRFGWIYLDNPAGKADIFIAKDSLTGMVVGAIAYFPIVSLFRGKEVLIAQAGDGMVHPDYRNQRIFNTLCKATIPCLKAKYEFLIGFPNSMSINSLIKAGWYQAGNMLTFTMLISSRKIFLNILRTRSLSQPASYFTDLVIDLFAQYRLRNIRIDNSKLSLVNPESIKCHEVYHTLTSIHQVMTIRDNLFIKWRFFQKALPNYSLLQYESNGKTIGYFTVKSEGGVAEIIDFCFEPELSEQIKSLALLRNHCKRNRLRAIHFRISDSNYFIKALKAAGFIERKRRTAILIYPFTEASRNISSSELHATIADTDWM
jgi:hypothetical protein